MRLHRFYIREKIGDQKTVTIESADFVNQVRNVFRLKKGDSVILFDGSGFDFTCMIETIERGSVALNILEKNNSRFVPQREIILCAAIVKKDNFEWIVEKATELGVTRIIPVLSERSEKKNLNEERLQKIAVEASEQSGRGDVPIIDPVTTLEQVVNMNIESAKMSLDAEVENDANGEKQMPVMKTAFHTEGEILTNANFADSLRSDLVFIGPEGGWSPAEIELFHKNNISVRCLGKQVLRAETAVVAALAKIIFYQ